MNLYQAGYYRRGKQGNNAGWGIVSPSKGMSQIAKDGFKGIAAKLVELKGTANMPVVNIGVFLHDRFVYLMHVNYAAKGDDARGVTFVHGYCFNTSDYYELCSNPAMLCGITENNFLMEYDSSVTAYSVTDGFSYDNYNFDKLLAKYKLNDAEYKKMIFAAINAIENYSHPLCIKLSLTSEQYVQTCKELLYLIMMGLPYHLRIKMSFFSFSGASAAIYISDHVEGNNYIDLDNREFSVDSSRLTQFHFTKIYNTLPAIDYQRRDVFFRAIAEFMNAAFENPFRDTGCAQVEAGFQAKIKKNDSEGICQESAVELLTAFLKYRLTDHDEVYEYLTALLNVINDYSLVIQDEKSINRIKNKYDKAQREDYRREVCRLIARDAMGQKEKSFDSLNALAVSSKEQFVVVLSEIKNKDEEYYTEYYYESYLPFALTSLEKVKAYLKENKNINLDEYKVLLSLVNKLVKKEMKEGFCYDQLFRIRNLIKELLCKFPEALEKEVNVVWDHTHFVFWNNFHVCDFVPEYINEYYSLKVDEIAQGSFRGEENTNAIKVLKLAELFEETDDEQIIIRLYEILFDENGIWGIADKKNVQKLLRETGNIDLKHPAGFDCMLAVTFDYDEWKFNTLYWGKKLLQKHTEAFDSFYISKMLKRSYILKDRKLKENFVESLQADIKAAKKGEGVYCSKNVIKGLKRYRDSLSGKEIKSDDDLESMQCYANSLHRLFVGELLLVAIIVLIKEMNCYETMKGMTVFLLGIIFSLLGAVLTGIKIYMAEDFEGLMENHGIVSVSQLIIYILLLLIMHAGGIVVFLMSDLKIIMACVLVYSVLAVISAIVYNILVED